MFITYVAKARAEDFLGVGTATVISHMDKSPGIKLLAPFALVELYNVYNAMEIAISEFELFGRNMIGESIVMPEPEKEERGRSKGRHGEKGSPLTQEIFLENLKKVSQRIELSETETTETSESDRDDDCSETHTH